jgi:hypothetical protein
MGELARITAAEIAQIGNVDFPVSKIEAKERAKQLVDGHDIELWQLGRKVALFKHKPE